MSTGSLRTRKCAHTAAGSDPAAPRPQRASGAYSNPRTYGPGAPGCWRVLVCDDGDAVVAVADVAPFDERVRPAPNVDAVGVFAAVWCVYGQIADAHVPAVAELDVVVGRVFERDAANA